MRIIKVNATHSTNSLAREWYISNKNSFPVCFVTGHQTMGRGQRGASWVSNAGENLMFSVLFPDPGISAGNGFIVSAGVGLVVLEVLNELKINKLKLKWPNDIMAESYKIGGILIENTLKNDRISSLIIGIGLNVNQTNFPGLPKAASLKKITGMDLDPDDILEKILVRIEKILNDLDHSSSQSILKRYEEVLFRRDKISTFELPDGKFLTGIIKGVTSTGLLKIQVEDEIIKTFDLKEIKLLF